MKLSDEDRAVLDAYHKRKQQAAQPKAQGINWVAVIFLLLAFITVAVLNIAGLI